MKHASIVLLIAMVSMASCAINQQKEIAKQPAPLDDEWSKWLVGEWNVVLGESDWLPDESGSAVHLEVEEGTGGFTVEFGLNGQFLIMRGAAELGGMTEEQIKQLKETMNASDEDMERFTGNPFKELQIHTIDPKTGEVLAYLFDSMRCIAEGRGRRQGNKEIIEWKWSGTGQGATSVHTIERIDDNKFTLHHKYTLPNGSQMEDKAEMIRKK
jgi:hypothetical protein